ncbi:MAG TPA: transglutaminase-like domain-containing protein [Rhizomicrobium sp.]|jgi:regulator of sirC expression with transglutaminase-like and TPR domain
MRQLPGDPIEYLRHLGEAGEGPLDIAAAALMLSALDHSGRDLEPYRSHLAEIADQARLEARLVRNAEDAASALAKLLVGRFGYDGDRLSYDDPQNADFIAVIDRRRGLPVALGILYMHAARAGGLDAAGLHSPGHFLLRIGLRGGEALIDPFNGGAALEREPLDAPPSMRVAASQEKGAMQTQGDIDVLLRLENNLKLRALQTGDRMRALEIAKRMVLIGPRHPDLWMDMARLNETEGALGAAQKAYEACLALALPGAPLHNEAALGLQALKRRLN